MAAIGCTSGLLTGVALTLAMVARALGDPAGPPPHASAAFDQGLAVAWIVAPFVIAFAVGALFMWKRS
ncbi:hypothetical protein SAMN05192583_1522 [Sphingomonas gellani]|uniref:Uncharacterized protein n=1 Tax=Sphingomonas gellani TaxID=1166340 RepID=A0A1H8CCZ5_9SPHN|nr:hypothetical protein SAMN05192583_1522 [Sphingomonas gellani]